MNQNNIFNSLMNSSGYITDNGWFLPSLDELNFMYDNLYSEGVGGFTSEYYWSSTEYSAIRAYRVYFPTGVPANSVKESSYAVRACRSFIAIADSYSLGSEGLSGGLIFTWVNNENGTYTYYEAAISDQSSGIGWSNIIDAEVTNTSLVIGEGLNNTIKIIDQIGHTTSAAKLCYDLN